MVRGLRLQDQTRPGLTSILADEKTKQALKWLSPVNPEESHLAARNLRQQGTGGWILDLPQYSTWIQERNTGLWVYGIRRHSPSQYGRKVKK